MKRVTLETIAKRVGVSKVVVYTVLNNREQKGIFVGAKTKEKILKTAKELGYVPSKSARELLKGKSDTIGIIFHRLTPFFSELVTELQQTAFKKHLEITPYITNGDPALEEHYLNQSRDGRVDGIIVIACTDGTQERLQKFSSPPYNLKIVAYTPPIKDIVTIYPDGAQEARIVYKHLKEIGCKRFATLGGNEEDSKIYSFKKTAMQDGHQPTIFTCGKWTGYLKEGEELTKRFLNEVKPIPDGVFCYNDLIALTLLSEAQRRGLNIPKDIAVISCDNTELCLHTNPTLTSIDTNISLVARELIAKIEKVTRGIRQPLHTKIPVSLIKRESTRRHKK